MGSRNRKESAKVSCREHVIIPVFMLIVQCLARLEVAVALKLSCYYTPFNVIVVRADM